MSSPTLSILPAKLRWTGAYQAATLQAVGTGTAFTSQTTFLAAGNPGVNVAGSNGFDQANQVVGLILVTGSDPGNSDATVTITASDGTVGSLTIVGSTSPTTIPTPTMTVAPTTIPTGQAFTATLTGSGTNWPSSTGFRCLVPAGMTGYTLNSATVDVANQVATLGVSTGTGAGTLTFSETADSAQATLTVTTTPTPTTPIPTSPSTPTPTTPTPTPTTPTPTPTPTTPTPTTPTPTPTSQATVTLDDRTIAAIRDAVWGAGTRTLSAFAFTVGLTPIATQALAAALAGSLPSFAFGSGTSQDSPANSLTCVVLDGPELLGAGAYVGQTLRPQSGANIGLAPVISSHTVSGTQHTFYLQAVPSPQLLASIEPDVTCLII